MKLSLGSLLLVLAWMPGQGPALPSEPDFQKAKDKLQADAQDPAANTVAGKYLAFVQGDFAGALPYLVLSGDKTLKSLAEHEQDPAYTDSPVKKVGMGDEWVAGAKKTPQLLKLFHERGAYWYGQAWGALDPVWKDKTRAQLRKLFQNPTVGDPKGLAAPTSWKLSDMAQRGMLTAKAAHGGRASFQVVAQKAAQPLSIALQQDVNPSPGSTYEFSGWVLPDGTDQAGDQIAVTVFVQGGKPVDVQRLFVPLDEPWWHYVHLKFVMPKDAVLLWVQVAVASRQGTLYVDDVSLKADGRETMKNGSFEEK